MHARTFRALSLFFSVVLLSFASAGWLLMGMIASGAVLIALPLIFFACFAASSFSFFNAQ